MMTFDTFKMYVDTINEYRAKLEAIYIASCGCIDLYNLFIAPESDLILDLECFIVDLIVNEFKDREENFCFWLYDNDQGRTNIKGAPSSLDEIYKLLLEESEAVEPKQTERWWNWHTQGS